MTDIDGRIADASVSWVPFLAVMLVVGLLQLRGSDILAAEMAVLVWTTSDRKGWL